MFDMLIVQAPDGPQPAPMVVQVANTDGQVSGYQEPINETFGICRFLPRRTGPTIDKTVYSNLEPSALAADIGLHDSSRFVDLINYDQAKVTILQKPKHGAMTEDYYYNPEAGFVGNDKVIFLVEGRDERSGMPVTFKLVYNLKVTKETEHSYVKNWDRIENKYCPKQLWKISSARQGGRAGHTRHHDVILPSRR